MASVASGAAGLAAGLAAAASGAVPAGSWKRRIKEAAYTSPGGTRIRFDYEDVSREFDKRTAPFDFPGVNDSYVQQNGHSSRRYPFRCIFSGAQCDKIATAFEAALLENGIGKLEHPLYGTFNVVPFGTITRRDDLKNAANQTIVEVTFWTTIGAIYPSSQAHPASEILAAIEGFDVAAAQQFDNAMNLKSVVNKANAKATLRSFLKNVSSTLQKAADATTAVNRQFRDLQSQVNFGMDVLIGQPLLLARQVTNLIKAPARALSGITSRLEAYHNLARLIKARAEATPAETLESVTALALLITRIANDFHTSDLVLSSSVASSVLAVVSSQFTTKPEALRAAEEVAAQLEELVEWREEGFAALSGTPTIGVFQLDPGTSYQALQQAVALTVGFLIQISFSLVPERRIVLDRARTIIDVAAELYGADADAQLDFLINSNDLTGEQLLELQAGQVIVYYQS